MANSDLDHGLVYTEGGFLDLARSPYFDSEFKGDTTVEGYLERVRFLIQETVEAQLGINLWDQELHPEASIHSVYAALQQGLTSRSSPIVQVAAAIEVHPVTSAGNLITTRYLRAFCGTMLCPLYPHNPEVLLNDLKSPSDLLDFGEFSDCMDFSSSGGSPRLHVVNPAFDYIPPKLVSLFITDTGGHSPSYMYRLIADYYSADDFVVQRQSPS